MANKEDLYSLLKPNIAAVANPLFEFSEQCLQKRDNFLPHAATLDVEGKVELFAVDPKTKNDQTNSAVILPLLHEGLRAKAKRKELVAIGVAENVTITPDNQASTQAIKILFEHKRGLVVAMYLPFENKASRDYSFGEIMTIMATSEVNAWS